MKKALLFLLFFVTIDFVCAININEVMYNPEGNDNNLEFVEIYGTNNLSNYIIADSASNDSLNLLQFVDSNYSLIVEEGFDYSNINCSVYSVGTTIGDNLNNDGDTITLYYDGSIVDSISYDGSLANGNGYSLELYNNTWIESLSMGGTPGGENHIFTNTSNQTNSTNSSSNLTCEPDIELSVYLDDILYKGLTYTKLFKLENLCDQPNIDDNITVFVHYNITSNNNIIKEDIFNKTINSYSTTNTGLFSAEVPGDYMLCGEIISSSINDTNVSNDKACKDFIIINTEFVPCNISLNLSTDKFVYNNSEKIKIRQKLNDENFPFIIEYWIEDLFGNMIKDPYNTSNTDQKTYTSNIGESDAVLVIKNRLAFVACNNSNNNTNNSVFAIVKNKKESNSSINILDVYTGADNLVKFGEMLRVKANIYKGDTSKCSVEVWLEKDNNKISYTSSFNANKKFTDYDTTIPIQIKPNCDMTYPDGAYTLFFEGLGISQSTQVNVEGILNSMCKESVFFDDSGSSSSSSGSTKQYQIINFSDNLLENATLKTTVRIQNKADETSHYKIWSYIYRGNKCYSGNRTGNILELDIEKLGTKDVLLENNFEGEPGEYKLKVKINKNSQKTDYDLTEDLVVEESSTEVKNQEQSILNENMDKSEKDLNSTSVFENSITGNTVVYESDNAKLKKNISYWVIGLLSIIVFVLIKKN